MSAPEWFCHLLGVNSNKFNKQENCILEAELYRQVLHAIWETCKAEYKDYFYLIQVNIYREEDIMELYIIRYLINELTKNKAYTLAGIARYAAIPPEIIENIFIGINIGHLITLPRRLMELHKIDQPDFYQNLFKRLLHYSAA